MDINKPTVCVGLCTFRRPGMLSKALNSFIEVIIPQDIRLVFLLSDNEADNTANKAVFDEFQKKVPYQCEFLVQERKGFTNNRNNILNRAVELDADFLLIFDDDQTLDRKWVVELLACQKKYQSNAVRGKVEYNYPSNMSMSDEVFKVFNNRKVHKTGDLLPYSGDGNVLVDIQLVKRLNLRLHKRFNEVGGSDALFFFQMTDAGGKIVYCEEAISYEEVPASRATDEWAYQRMFRIGYTRYLLQVYRFGKIEALRNNFWFWMRRTYQNRKKIRKSPHGETVELKMEKVYLKGIISSIIGRKFSEYDVIHGY